MQTKVYSLFDRKVGVHSVPMFFTHEGYFLRAVMEIVKDPNTNVGRHPADFELLYLGTFDDNTGRFDQAEGVKSLGYAVAFLPARADTLFDTRVEQAQEEQHPLLGVA